MGYMREYYLLFKNRSSSGFSVAGMERDSSTHNWTVHRADTNEKYWDISYEKTPGFGGDVIRMKPCKDSLGEHEYNALIEGIGVSFKVEIKMRDEPIGTMTQDTNYGHRSYNKNDTENAFDIEFGDKDITLSLRSRVPYGEHEFLTTNKKDYRKPFGTFSYGASDLALVSKYYKNDKKRGYYIKTEEDDFPVYILFMAIYEVWKIRETNGDNMTASSLISDEKPEIVKDISKLANGLKGRFKKFLK